jgi:hypothetical protein
MTDVAKVEIPTRYPRRLCDEWVYRGAAARRCRGLALAFIEDAICVSHADEPTRELNHQRYRVWLTANAETETDSGVLPSDVILSFWSADTSRFAVRFGYRSDVIAALRRIAGAKYEENASEKCWTFPRHRMEKVVEVCQEFFEEIIFENITPKPKLKHVEIWQKVS